MLIAERSNDEHIKKRKKSALPLSVWLSYLLIATLVVSGVTLARYTATSYGGNTSARVANFAVFAKGKTEGQPEADLTSGEGSYEFTVENNSEVAVTYSVTVSGVPSFVDMNLYTGEEVIPMYKTATETEEGILTYVTEAKALDIGGIVDCKLTFDLIDNTQYGEVGGISIQVKFEQID